MVEKVFLFIIFFSSLGVFIKLKRYGAPNSSILYSIGLPGAVFLFGAIYGFKSTRKIYRDKQISLRIAVKVYMLFLIRILKSLSLMTGIMCVQLGKRKIGIGEMVRVIISNFEIQDINRILKNTIKNIYIYNISFEKQSLYLRKV